MNTPPRVLYGLLFYALVMSAIVVYRPRMLFDEEGAPIPFGVGKERTVIDLGTIAAVIAMLSFALFTIVDVIAGA